MPNEWEWLTGTMYVCFDNDIDTSDTIQFHLFILVFAPITKGNEVFPSGVEFLVSLNENRVFVQAISELECLLRFNPRIIVD